MRIVFILIVLFSGSTAIAQQNFKIKVQPSAITAVPPVHSGSFASYNGKWIFIGGRTNGLHGFLPPFAFPSSGINDSVFIVDPFLNTRISASLSILPDTIREQLSSSNPQYFQDDSMLYVAGGYGWCSLFGDFMTFPYLSAIHLPSLISSVTGGGSISPSIRQVLDSSFAVTGGNLGKAGSVYQLVFGHRFDGIYSVNDTAGFFTQKYTNEIRRFTIVDDGTILVHSFLQPMQDTMAFHRRDFNLVPQIFPGGQKGYTAFSGVFRYDLNLPWLTSIDLVNDTAIEQAGFFQRLSSYSSATLPVFDSSAQIMHTVFFGGISLYWVDSMGVQHLDSLVPFVDHISIVSRTAGGLQEYLLEEKMPGLLGTNSYFIPDGMAPFSKEGILALNESDTVQRVGFIAGGILSPEPNISTTDASLSTASGMLYEVILEKTIPANLPRPFRGISHGVMHASFRADLGGFKVRFKTDPGPVWLEVYNRLGQSIASRLTFSTGEEQELLIQERFLASGLYLICLRTGTLSAVKKVVVGSR